MKRNLCLKIWILVVVVLFASFSDWTLAEGKDAFEIMWWSLNFIISILSWIRIFFAKLAWTFLTNKWVYGEVFWLDVLFRKFRNIMKNIANFWLWFYFIYVIWKWFFSQWKWDITKNLKNVILWLLVWWIWIQSSWFLTATVIDLSTITLAAAWAFPSQIISDNAQIEWAMKDSLSEYLDPKRESVNKGERISLFSTNEKAWSFLKESSFELVEPKTFTWFVEALLPTPEDVSWPLYYMWLSILKTNVLASMDSSSEKGLKSTILNLIMQWWTTVVFSIEMFVLCVLALIRIVYLWMFIILSPLTVLLWCIQKSWEKISGWDKSFIASFMDQINLKTFLINVFKPTIIVLWIWITVIFLSLMNKVVIGVGKNENNFNYQWTTFYSKEDSKSNLSGKWDQTYTTEIDNWLLNFTLTNVWKTLLEIILSIITVIVIYLIIKFVITLWWWKDFVSSKVWKIQKWIWDLLWSVPVVPVAGYDKIWKPVTHYISAKRTFGLDNNDSLLESTIGKYQWKVDEYSDEQSSIVSSRFNNKTGYLTFKEKSDIEAIGNNASLKWIDVLNKIRDVINRIKTEEWKWMTLSRDTAKNDGFWIDQFGNRLTAMESEKVTGTSYDAVWNKMISDWKSSQITDIEKKLEYIFKDHTDRIKAYADFFGLWNITTWEELKKADIAKK